MMSKVGLKTKLKMARRSKRRVDMQNRQLGLRNRILSERVAELEAEVADWKLGSDVEAEAGDEARRALAEFNNFWHWVAHGEKKGWISEPACATHDGIPGTPEENEAWEDGYDPCQHVLRLWPDES